MELLQQIRAWEAEKPCACGQEHCHEMAIPETCPLYLNWLYDNVGVGVGFKEVLTKKGE